MYEPKVSIIIPAHNEEAYVASCIEASLAQSYPNVEVIVVDNASTDATFTIASSYPVRVFEEHRKGTQWARQCGLQHATGDLIATIDAGCVPDKNWLETGVGYFIDERVSGVTGSYNYHDAPPLARIVILFGMQYLYRPLHYVLTTTGLGAISIGGNTIIRKSSIDAVGGFNTAIEFWGDDTDTALRLSKVGKLLYVKSLVMKTSYRRFEKEGFLKLILKYQRLFLVESRKKLFGH